METPFPPAQLRLPTPAQRAHQAVREMQAQGLIHAFTLSRRDKKLKVADKAIDKLKARVRQLSQRTRGHKVERIVEELRTSLLGWRAYFGITEVRGPLADLDKWIRRRLRCYQWKQWGSRGYRELRKRGVSVREAWNTSKSAHGPPVVHLENPGARARHAGQTLQEPGAAQPS